MSPRDRILDALATYGARLEAEDACATCGHPRRLHAELADWCARCAKACRFTPEARS